MSEIQIFYVLCVVLCSDVFGFVVLCFVVFYVVMLCCVLCCVVTQHNSFVTILSWLFLYIVLSGTFLMWSCMYCMSICDLESTSQTSKSYFKILIDF